MFFLLKLHLSCCCFFFFSFCHCREMIWWSFQRRISSMAIWVLFQRILEHGVQKCLRSKVLVFHLEPWVHKMEWDWRILRRQAMSGSPYVPVMMALLFLRWAHHVRDQGLFGSRMVFLFFKTSSFSCKFGSSCSFGSSDDFTYPLHFGNIDGFFWFWCFSLGCRHVCIHIERLMLRKSLNKNHASSSHLVSLMTSKSQLG